MKDTSTVLIDKNPGRNSQTFGIAREIGTDLELMVKLKHIKVILLIF